MSPVGHRSLWRRCTISLMCCLTLASCAVASVPNASDTERTAVILAASSIAPAIEAALAAAGIDAAVSGAGSQVIAAQVRAGAPADLVVLADENLARQLAAELGPDRLGPPLPLASTGLSLVARAGLDQPVSTREALNDGDLDLILADSAVPLGAATAEALAIEGIVLDPDRVVSLEDSAAGVLAKIRAGAADLAIVYTANILATDASRLITLGPLAPDVFVVLSTQTLTPLGDRIAMALRTPEATELLLDLGFTATP